MIDITHIDYTGVPPFKRERCEHKIQPNNFELYKNRPRCKHSAVFIIEGKKLCERHAGRWLISYHLHEAKEDTGIREL